MTFEIFKSGKHTSSNGITKEYTNEDLDKMVENFKDNKDGVPVVVGHPKDNSPAYAWLGNVKRVDDKLVADTKDENPDFLKALKNKTYKNRSVSLTPEGALRHVGFLGGAAPAVKGLSPVTFSSDQGISFESEMPEIDFGVTEKENEGNADENGSENNETDESENKTLQNDKRNSENNDSKLAAFKEAFTPVADSLTEMKASLDKMNENFSDGINSLSEEEVKKVYDKMSEINFRIKVSEFELLLNEKLAYGSVTPAMKQKIMSLIQYLNSQNFSTDFSPQKYQDDINSLLGDLINSIPKIIHYENFAEKPDEGNVNIKEEDYGGLTLDEDSSKLHKEVVALMEKEEISYLSAVNRLSNN